MFWPLNSLKKKSPKDSRRSKTSWFWFLLVRYWRMETHSVSMALKTDSRFTWSSKPHKSKRTCFYSQNRTVFFICKAILCCKLMHMQFEWLTFRVFCACRTSGGGSSQTSASSGPGPSEGNNGGTATPSPTGNLGTPQSVGTSPTPSQPANILGELCF